MIMRVFLACLAVGLELLAMAGRIQDGRNVVFAISWDDSDVVSVSIDVGGEVKPSALGLSWAPVRCDA
jgi:hypothetical protein